MEKLLNIKVDLTAPLQISAEEVLKRQNVLKAKHKRIARENALYNGDSDPSANDQPLTPKAEEGNKGVVKEEGDEPTLLGDREAEMRKRKAVTKDEVQGLVSEKFQEFK